jgi:hypothetical protein
MADSSKQRAACRDLFQLEIRGNIMRLEQRPNSLLRVLAAGCLLTVSLAAMAVTPEEDFAFRKSQPGVIRSEGFDTAAAVNAHVFPDGNFEKSGGGFVSTLKASGGGSLGFVAPPFIPSGAWRVNFSDAMNVTFGAGEEFYVQWRQRFDSNMINVKFPGSGGWKQIILGQGDDNTLLETGSCTELELVMQNIDLAGFPRMYHNCGVYQGFYEAFGAYDFKLQNKMPSPFCLYSNHGGCFMYKPDQWMTFQIHVKLGPRGTAASSLEGGKSVTGFTNSTVEFWVADEGKPSQLALSWTGVVLHESAGKEYGKVWLLPYQTNKDYSADHPTAHTWYDELIISTQKIPDPAVGLVRPNAPASVQAK